MSRLHSSDDRAEPRRRRRSALAAWLVAASLAAAPPAYAQRLPSLGDPTLGDFSVATERRLGEQIMREIQRDPDYLDDPPLQEYLDTVWLPLVAAARQRGEIGAEIEQRYAWRAFLVRDRSVNAFALPGGHVGVHLGLIALADSRDELAAVLAHELTHVTQRHIGRSISHSQRQSIIGIAAMIVGVLAATRSNSRDAANAVIVGSQAASLQGQLNFSRDMEREADRIGVSLMGDAGFAPGGMAAMFEKLDKSQRLNDAGNYPYLRSHPLTVERIGEARARLGTRATVPRAVDLDHALARARARVLMDSRTNALRNWQSLDAHAAAPRAEKLAAAYSNALASTLLRDWTRADAALDAAARLLRPDEDAKAARAFAMLAAQSRLDRGDVAQAAAVVAPLETAGMAGAVRRPVMLLAAQVALATRAPAAEVQRHVDALQPWVAQHPADAAAWSLLSQLWQRSGQPLRAVRADAESRYALGDLEGAIERLRAGQRSARVATNADFIEASVIDARLRDVEAERRRIAIEMREAG